MSRDDLVPNRIYLSGDSGPESVARFTFIALFSREPQESSIASFSAGLQAKGFRGQVVGLEREGLRETLEGCPWEAIQGAHTDLVREAMESSFGCLIDLRHPDSEDLHYLQDIVQAVVGLIELGATVVLDGKTMSLWSARDFRSAFLKPTLNVFDHVAVLVEARPGDVWYRTRGMSKFGRSDVSLVAPSSIPEKTAVALIDRFIEYQALGGMVADGTPVKVAGFPKGWVCRNIDLSDDPEFSNRVLEITPPG